MILFSLALFPPPLIFPLSLLPQFTFIFFIPLTICIFESHLIIYGIRSINGPHIISVTPWLLLSPTDPVSQSVSGPDSWVRDLDPQLSVSSCFWMPHRYFKLNIAPSPPAPSLLLPLLTTQQNKTEKPVLNCSFYSRFLLNHISTHSLAHARNLKVILASPYIELNGSLCF